MTAAAATGPASGLIPASSTPATCSTPAAQSAFSNCSSLRNRCPSERFSARRRAMAFRMAFAPGRGSALNAASVSVSSGRASMTKLAADLSKRQACHGDNLSRIAPDTTGSHPMMKMRFVPRATPARPCTFRVCRTCHKWGGFNARSQPQQWNPTSSQRVSLRNPKPEETPLRKQFIISACSALIITSGLALAQYETPQQYDKSSAPSGLQSTTPDKAPVVTLPEGNTPAPETTGQAANFDDRWSAQSETPGRLPTATMPGADAPRTTDQPQRSLLDQGNGNWDPPPVTAPSTQR